MKRAKNRRKSRRGITLLIIALSIVLIAVIAVIIWREWEYSASADFYAGLRGMIYTEGGLACG